MRELREFTATAPLAPQLAPISTSPSSTGLRFVGDQASASIAHPSGVVVHMPGTETAPSRLTISDLAPGGRGGEDLWLCSDATPWDLAFPARRRVVWLSVPLSALTVDAGVLDLRAGSAIDAPPIATQGLRSLVEVVARDVGEWLTPRPGAIDRYLIGVANLVVSAIVESMGAGPDAGEELIRIRAIELIESSFGDPGLAPARIARALGVSLRTLCRAFEGQLGVAHRLRDRRLSHAAELLADPSNRHMAISEIAKRSGFASRATFDRVFHDTYDTSASQLRADARPWDWPE